MYTGIRGKALRVTSLDRFYNLPLMKNFLYRFLRNYQNCKVETWYTHGQWVDVSCVWESGAGPITLGVTSFDRFYNLPLMNIFITDFSGAMKALKVKIWDTHGQWAVVLCIPESGPSYIP